MVYLVWIIVDPWEHLLGIGIGVVAVNQFVKWEVKCNEDLNKLLEKSKHANERRYFGKFSSIPLLSFTLFSIGF